MASRECFHFTKLKYLYSIRNDGLLPKLDINSKAVGDTKPKISFSDSRVGAVGLFLEFNRVYKAGFFTGPAFYCVFWRETAHFQRFSLCI